MRIRENRPLGKRREPSRLRAAIPSWSPKGRGARICSQEKSICLCRPTPWSPSIRLALATPTSVRLWLRVMRGAVGRTRSRLRTRLRVPCARSRVARFPMKGSRSWEFVCKPNLLWADRVSASHRSSLRAALQRMRASRCFEDLRPTPFAVFGRRFLRKFVGLPCVWPFECKSFYNNTLDILSADTPFFIRSSIWTSS